MNQKLIPRIVIGVVVVFALGGLAATREVWGPTVIKGLGVLLDPDGTATGCQHNHDHDTSGLGRDAASANHRIDLSEQAQQNIGLATIDLEPGTFSRTITVPGIVTEKPGHSDVEVTAPIAGVITQVYPLRGETVEPNDPLFRLRLTHEEIVQAQTELLKTTEELDVIAREIARLEKITEGAVPGRNLLERKYDQQKLEAVQRAQLQAMVLHGLAEEQVKDILKERRLLKEVLIYPAGGERVEG